jgi:hypothetical protein
MAFSDRLRSIFSPSSGAAGEACVLIGSEAELDAAVASRD